MIWYHLYNFKNVKNTHGGVFFFGKKKKKIAGSNFFGKLKIDGNLVVKSKMLPFSGSVDLRQLNPIHKKGP